MDKWFSILAGIAMVCFTVIVVQQCHYTHDEAMKCIDKGGTYFNDRCNLEKK
jgi:hypothetical protein